MEIVEWSSATFRLRLKLDIRWLCARFLLFRFCFPSDKGRLLVESNLRSLRCYTSRVTLIAWNDLTVCNLRAFVKLVDVVHVAIYILGPNIGCWDSVLPTFVDDEFESLTNADLQFLTNERSFWLVAPNLLAPSALWLSVGELTEHLDTLNLIDTHFCGLKSECCFDNSLFLSLLLQNIRSECSLNLGSLIKDHLAEVARIRSFHTDVHL